MSTARMQMSLLELDVPEGVPEAEQAVELIRAWVADGALVVALNGEAFGSQLEEWGRSCADRPSRSTGRISEMGKRANSGRSQRFAKASMHPSRRASWHHTEKSASA